MSGVGVTGIISNLPGTITPYPVTDDTLGLGGWHCVANATDRDAIPQNFRKVGMIAALQDTGAQFILIGGIANINWQPLSFATNAPLSDVLYVDKGSTTGAPNGSSSAPYKTITAAVAAAVALPGNNYAFIIAPGQYDSEPPITITKGYTFWGLGTNVSGTSFVTSLPDMVTVGPGLLSFRNCNVGSITHDGATGGATIDLQYCNCSGVTGSSAGGTSVYSIGVPNSPIGNLNNCSQLSTLVVNGGVYFGSFFTPTSAATITLNNCLYVSNQTDAIGSGTFSATDTTFGLDGALAGFANIFLDPVSLSAFQTRMNAGTTPLTSTAAPLFYTITSASSVAADFRLRSGMQRLNLTTDTTIAVTAGPIGVWCYLFLTQGTSGSHLPTFTGVVWAGGAPPTFSTAVGKTDVVALLNDGTRMLATTESLLGFI